MRKLIEEMHDQAEEIFESCETLDHTTDHF